MERFEILAPCNGSVESGGVCSCGSKTDEEEW